MSSVRKVTRKVFTPLKSIIYIAVILFIAAGWMWWSKVYNGENHIFWDMVNNNLTTSSFTQTSVQDDGNQKVEQVTQTQLTPTRLSNSKTNISQIGASVTTESIGTPTVDYVRYTAISTSQKNSAGQPMDFSAIKNVWGKTTVQDAITTNGQLYTQSVMSVVPMGNLSKVERAALVSTMKRTSVYTPTLTKTTQNGLRKTYTFSVVVKASSYIAALQQFGKDYGLNQLDSIDPSQYESASDVTVTMEIDGWSHQLKQISYGDGARIENFSAFGSQKLLNTPPADKDTISVDELQYRLQAVQ